MSVQEAERHPAFLLGGVEPARAHLEGEVRERATIIDHGVGWSVIFEDQPLAAQGATRADAIASMIDELRLYSSSWPTLARTPEHAANWPLAQLVAVSTDAQLAEWIERQTHTDQ